MIWFLNLRSWSVGDTNTVSDLAGLDIYCPERLEGGFHLNLSFGVHLIFYGGPWDVSTCFFPCYYAHCLSIIERVNAI